MSYGPPVVVGSAEMALAGEVRTVSDDLAGITSLSVPEVSTLTPRWGNMFMSVSICARCRMARSSSASQRATAAGSACGPATGAAAGTSPARAANELLSKQNIGQ